MPRLKEKIYLGDGVYAAVDADTGDVVLTTEDGFGTTNRIILEPPVWTALRLWMRQALGEAD